MRPTIQIDSIDYTVTEISERGMRVLRPNGFAMAPEDPIEGVIHFPDGSTSEVEGSFLRRQQDEVVFAITSGISYKRMLDEQLHIVHKFPSYFKDGTE